MSDTDEQPYAGPAAWFDLGAEAIARVLPGYPRSSVCPWCLTGFLPAALDLGSLTRDHAPPRSLGGAPLVLTCRKCNNSAGSRLNAHMRVMRTNWSSLGQSECLALVGGMPTWVSVQFRRDHRLVPPVRIVEASAKPRAHT